MYTNVTVIRTCGINECQNTVQWIYEPGEPQTWEHPGSPDYWIPDGCDSLETIPINWNIEGMPKDDTIQVTHSEMLADDDTQQAITDRVALESFDSEWTESLVHLPF